MFAKKPYFESGSRLCVGKVLAPHSVRHETVPIIKYEKRCDFQNI